MCVGVGMFGCVCVCAICYCKEFASMAHIVYFVTQHMVRLNNVLPCDAMRARGGLRIYESEKYID